MKTALVIPSNRPECLKQFFAQWRERQDWDETIVVFDGPEAPPIPEADLVLSWRSIDSMPEEQRRIFSRENAGIRTLGYLIAAHRGADVIATIDDDCYPTEDALMESHLKNLFGMPRWTSSAANMTARGVPYRNLGTLEKVMINVGLWQSVADYDAPRSLVEGGDLRFYLPPPDSRVIAKGQYVPVSTMNLAFRVEALPLMYLPLMGRGQPYDRFDDIWGGIIAKKICDELDWFVSVGRPVVDHQRASNPFRNLVKEATGIERNETFWQVIDEVHLDNWEAGHCIDEFACAFADSDEPYIAELGRSLDVWNELATEAMKKGGK